MDSGMAGAAAPSTTLASMAGAEVSQDTLTSFSAPPSVETQIGPLEFTDGAPSAGFAQMVHDELGDPRALDLYDNSFRGAPAVTPKTRFPGAGAKNGGSAIHAELMEWKLAASGKSRLGMMGC